MAVGFNTALFFIAYRYFPHRRVPVGAALCGAILASLLWEAAKQLFRWYILSFGAYDKIYGPLGALVALSHVRVLLGGRVRPRRGVHRRAILARPRRGTVARQEGLC